MKNVTIEYIKIDQKYNQIRHFVLLIMQLILSLPIESAELKIRDVHKNTVYPVF